LAILGAIHKELLGKSFDLPDEFVRQYPALAGVRYRRGGLPLRIGGWALGTSTAAAITLWRTVFVSDGASLEARLLLHELRHVQQFFESKTFPLRYIWESLRRGYHNNRYEIEAREFADARLAGRKSDTTNSGGAQW
jgi:hypothetical protein